jgi:hypothetical protein
MSTVTVPYIGDGSQLRTDVTILGLGLSSDDTKSLPQICIYVYMGEREREQR